MAEVLEFSNRILSIAIVIIAVSMLLYFITRNIRDRVTRASSILLGCISLTYLADMFIALEPHQVALENWFRVQWVGVVFVPAALFHLSDALLATTGRLSRGRRRKAVRAAYLVGLTLGLAGLFGESMIRNLNQSPVWHMEAGNLFPIYLAYFVVIVSAAFINVARAWQRALTTYTRRRMTYLLASLLTPAWGIFPYSLLFSTLPTGLTGIAPFWLWLTFNVANIAVLAMLAFMAYPLSFFGAYKPDRVIKAELLQFMLRGPLTGVAIVGVIESFPHVSSVFGVDGQEFVALAAVGAVLCLQWGITLIMPWLETHLIYTDDQQQARLYQEIGQRLLTRADIAQLQEAILAAVCDRLQTKTAFIASITPTGARLEQYIGHHIPPETETELVGISNGAMPKDMRQHGDFFLWESFWLLPLRSPLVNGDSSDIIGLMGIFGRADEPNLDDEEAQILKMLANRATEILTDMRLQTQILIAIQELIPETITESPFANVSAFGQLSINETPSTISQPRKSIVSSSEFTDMVKNALRDYWGGPKLMESELLNLELVDQAADDHDGNRVTALRQVLVDAIERLRPEGQQNFTRTDWILYNILEMRFLQGRKVRDVALRLAMSHADFYRKQRTAIEEVARIISEQEEYLNAQMDLPERDLNDAKVSEPAT